MAHGDGQVGVATVGDSKRLPEELSQLSFLSFHVLGADTFPNLRENVLLHHRRKYEMK